MVVGPRHQALEKRHRAQKIVGIGRDDVGLAEIAEQIDERAQRPGIVGRSPDDERRACLTASSDDAISRTHPPIIAAHEDERVFVACRLGDGQGVVRAAVIEHDDGEVLNGHRQCVVNALDRRKQLFRIVVGDDKNRQRPRAHQHSASASPDFPVGHLLTMCEEQKGSNSLRARAHLPCAG